jgi:hypothetical protein
VVVRARSIVGSWLLRSWTTVDGSGNEHEPFGSQPSGILVYAPDGWMATVITPSAGRGGSRPDLPDPQACIGYSGRYEVGDDVVVHLVEVGCRSNWVGSRQVRALEMDPSGTTLILTAHATEVGGVTGVHRLVWTAASSECQPRGGLRPVELGGSGMATELGPD